MSVCMFVNLKLLHSKVCFSHSSVCAQKSSLRLSWICPLWPWRRRDRELQFIAISPWWQRRKQVHRPGIFDPGAKYNFFPKKKNVLPEVSQFSIHSGLSPSFYPHLKIKLVTGLAVFKAPWWASMCAAWSFPSSNPVFMLLQISNVISITLPFHVFQTPPSNFRIGL